MCLLPGSDVAAGCRAVCGAPGAAAAESTDVLSVEEEGPEGVPGAALSGAFSTSMLRPGDPGFSRLLHQVRKQNKETFHTHPCYNELSVL